MTNVARNITNSLVVRISHTPEITLKSFAEAILCFPEGIVKAVHDRPVSEARQRDMPVNPTGPLTRVTAGPATARRGRLKVQFQDPAGFSTNGVFQSGEDVDVVYAPALEAGATSIASEEHDTADHRTLSVWATVA